MIGSPSVHLPCILILVHQGYSYCDELARIAGELGAEPCFLSSQVNDVSAPWNVLKDSGHWMHEACGAFLSEADVDQTLAALVDSGRHVVAAVATMEGYRLLAARVNGQVRGMDSSPEALRLALDKLGCRLTLQEAGLSSVQCELASPESIYQAMKSGQKKFLKPRRGAASFGTFSLRPDFQYSVLEELIHQMREDKDIACVFYENFDYLIEDYIPGIEYSFEVIAFDSEVYLIASHEKGIDEETSTVLETFLISPPPTASFDSREARAFVTKCLHALHLTAGCFHVEMKHTGEGWEVLEINPRVGGSLVNDSVRAVTGGLSMLDLWMRVLLQGALKRDLNDLHQLLEERCETSRQKRNGIGTVIRQYFGKVDGSTVDRIVMEEVDPQPVIKRIHVAEGEKLPHCTREIIVGEAMWTLPLVDFASRVSTVRDLSYRMIQFAYV